MTRKSFEAIIETRADTRYNRDYAAYLAREKRESAADGQIGALIRYGKVVLYVWPAGGRYREGSRFDLIDHLIRNNYA